ncbi:nuclear transport factor 2 family protein [Dinoroseobacter sp. S76]|uniref:nuclear transport factor 2 family protein n=1 Tax=Dinoroseobacter sp. S76 TaxID=3415124 RepID=UPI003C7A2AB4
MGKTDLDKVLQNYGAAWNATDASERATLLAASFAKDGLYCDPSARVEGRTALVAHIGGMQEGMPGALLELTSGPDTHHGFVRFHWHLRGADGAVAITGLDCCTLADDGRLQQVIGFFGEVPALQ